MDVKNQECPFAELTFDAPEECWVLCHEREHVHCELYDGTGTYLQAFFTELDAEHELKTLIEHDQDYKSFEAKSRSWEDLVEMAQISQCAGTALGVILGIAAVIQGIAVCKWNDQDQETEIVTVFHTH